MSTLAESVYIPDSSVRTQVIQGIQNESPDLEIKNGLPTITELGLLNEVTINAINSIEGLQYATNLSHLSNNSWSVIDYRPIASLTNLKTYYSYNSLGEGDNIIDLRPFSNLKKAESIYLGYGNVTDLSPLENLDSLTYFYSMGSQITLPTTYVSKELKTFIIEQPVKYSSQFTDITVKATTDKNEKLDVKIENGAVIIENLDVDVKEVELNMLGSSEYFDGVEGFQSSMSFVVPISWY